MSKKWLIGQGSAAMDTLLYCKSKLPEGGFAEVREEALTSGGSGANLLVTAAQLGMPSALIAKVGDDAFGKTFRKELIEDLVDDRYLIECEGQITLHTYVLVTPDGERSILVHPGNCFETLRFEELPGNTLEDAAVFYTDGSPLSVAVKLTEQARNREIPVFYQRECKAHGWTAEDWAGSQRIMDCADIISGGPEIYEELVGTADPEIALRALFEKHTPASGVIMTAGKRGAYWYEGEELLHQPIFEVHSIDSTGAGDSFCGALIYAYYYRGLSKAESLRFAAACGAMKCTIPGPRLRKTEAEVMEFIRHYDENRE